MTMKKFINDPANLTAELLDGYVKAYANKVALESESWLFGPKKRMPPR